MRDDAVVPREVLLDRRIGDREKVLYGLVLLHQDEGGLRTNASAKSLARMTGMDAELVTASLRILESCAYVSMYRFFKHAEWEIELVMLERQKMQARPRVGV